MDIALSLTEALRDFRAVRIDFADGQAIVFAGVESVDSRSGVVSVILGPATQNNLTTRRLRIADIAQVVLLSEDWF